MCRLEWVGYWFVLFVLFFGCGKLEREVENGVISASRDDDCVGVRVTDCGESVRSPVALPRRIPM